MIRHMRARLRQVDRIIRSVDREEQSLSDRAVETLDALRRELNDVGRTIEALQQLERSKPPKDPNVTAIGPTRRRTAPRSRQ